MDEQNKVFDNNENQNGKEKSKKVVFVLGIAIVIVAVTLTIILIGAIASSKSENTSDEYETTEGSMIQSSTDGLNMDEFLNVDGAGTDSQGSANIAPGETVEKTQAATSGGTTKNQLIESYEALSVNGENKLSDHYDNQYIKLVNEKYGVDEELLVAIYSVPDTGTNFVLEFSGKKNLKGEYVKSPDTLVKVYQIDAAKNIKVATGKPTGNEGVSYAESVMTVAMIKTIVMEQYPDYFTGLQ